MNDEENYVYCIFKKYTTNQIISNVKFLVN